LVEHRGQWQLENTDQTYGPLPAYEVESGLRVLQSANLAHARQIVAFDMIERSETVKKGEAQTAFVRMKDGDSSLFKAVDSAIKAAFFWRREDYQTPQEFATVTVPVCLLSGPFWEVCIDSGRVGQPELLHRGWLVNLYPAPGRPAQELMCLMWSAEELPELIGALDQVFAWFSSDMNKEYQRVKPAPSRP
jgi:hypothetical protein